jgi:class 3 adenylate cyclase
MLATMSEIDPRADVPVVHWSELGVSGLLPTGTVTLLLADVEGSTWLWAPHSRLQQAGPRKREQLVQEAVRHS